jgi:membrane protein
VPDPPPGPQSSVPLPGRFKRALAAAAGLEERFLLLRIDGSPRGRLLRAGQVGILALRRYREDHAGDRAAALAFATLLSLLPLMLLALAVFGAVGMEAETLKSVREWLIGYFVPDTARELQQTLESALESVQRSRGGFGTAGFLVLVLTGWKLLATLQRSLEQVWGVRDFASRMKRIVGFWSAVLVAPFLVAASLVLSGSVDALEARGALPSGGGFFAAAAAFFVPAAAGWAGILLAYRYCTGKRTPWRAAAWGATVAALLWEVLKIGFAHYMQHAYMTRTLLTGMGVLPLFLLWLYLSWVAFMIGAELAYVMNDYGAAMKRCGIERPT